MTKRKLKQKKFEIAALATTSILLAGFTYLAVLLPLIKIQEAKSWVKTKCTIESVETDTYLHQSYSPRIHKEHIIRYSYYFQGKTYESSLYSFAGKYNGSPPKVGAGLYCFVNPNNPSEAVIDKNFSLNGWIIPSFVLILFAFCFYGTIYTILELKQMNRHKH